MRIHPTTQIQLIFHRGVKKIENIAGRVIENKTNLLVWKENDRAIVTFKTAMK